MENGVSVRKTPAGNFIDRTGSCTVQGTSEVPLSPDFERPWETEKKDEEFLARK
jgi:hypothetical protein